MFSLSSFLDFILPYSGPAVPDLAYIETDPVEEGEIPEAFPDRPGMPSFTFMLSSTYVFNFFTCWFYPTFPFLGLTASAVRQRLEELLMGMCPYMRTSSFP